MFTLTINEINMKPPKWNKLFLTAWGKKAAGKLKKQTNQKIQPCVNVGANIFKTIPFWPFA